jgi:hypothetical protein
MSDDKGIVSAIGRLKARWNSLTSRKKKAEKSYGLESKLGKKKLTRDSVARRARLLAAMLDEGYDQNYKSAGFHRADRKH